MKKMYSITVKSTNGTVYGFPVELDPRHIDGYVASGLDVREILNTIPQRVAALGLTKPWCFIQDVFNFKNPWSKSNEQ